LLNVATSKFLIICEQGALKSSALGFQDLLLLLKVSRVTHLNTSLISLVSTWEGLLERSPEKPIRGHSRFPGPLPERILYSLDIMGVSSPGDNRV
jgi:hypothetical protein